MGSCSSAVPPPAQTSNRSTQLQTPSPADISVIEQDVAATLMVKPLSSHASSLTNVSIDIDGLALRKAVGQRSDSPERHRRTASDELSGIRLLKKDIHRTPGDRSYAEKEKNI